MFRKEPLQDPNNYALIFVIGVACVAFGARELRLCPFPYPQSTWQVPIEWRRLPLFLMSFTYAFVLGVGVLTRIPAGSFFIVIAWI